MMTYSNGWLDFGAKYCKKKRNRLKFLKKFALNLNSKVFK